MGTSNQDVSKLLRSVAAALTLKKSNPFQVRAYDNAADTIEHLDSEIRDLWEEGKLNDVPGIGAGLQEHLNEFFKTGEVAHFKSLMKGFEPALFDFLEIPGIGPKTALELTELGVKDKEDLIKKVNDGSLIKKGFSEKIAQKLGAAVKEEPAKSGRMLLPFAMSQAQKILDYMKKSPDVISCDPLGSLRRQVATIGDLDFAVSSANPQKAVDHFVKMPGVSRIVDHGDNKGSVILNSGLRIDLLVGEPQNYGALLQHFTGGKNHNIKLRSEALNLGFSLSEHGLKNTKTGKVLFCKTEDDVYSALGMQTPPPEMREDLGEVELALKKNLPKLVERGEIKGDFHLHSNFPFPSPSHGPGANPLEIMVDQAVKMKYQYVGLSDHPPGFRIVSETVLAKEVEERSKEILKLKSKKNIRVLNGLEIDILPDGTLSVPDKVLQTLDYAIAGVHSSHRMEKEKMTKRILKALENSEVDILAHPTGRILNQRNSYEADWEEIFKFCAKNKKLLEINAFPDRLDLRDDLVRMAKELGCKFIIDTDSHEVSQMANMPFGVAVARRGWLEAEDVLNTWEWKKIAQWFRISL